MFATPSRRISLSALAVVAALGVVAFRVVGTRTTFGQRFDLSAIQNGLTLPAGALNASNALLKAISATSIVLVGALLVGVSVARRRFDLAVATGVMIPAPFATTELLKHSLHTRPGVPDYLSRGFPSGHATVALSVGLALTLATPPRHRLFAAGLAAVYAATMGTALVFNAWHLPSDVGGGFCVALAWAAIAARLSPRPAERGIPLVLLGGAAVATAGAGLAAYHLRPGLSFSATGHGRLLEAAIGIALAAVVCSAAFAYAITARSDSATRS
jgi:membrane-associated phospholipid phosphatase